MLIYECGLSGGNTLRWWGHSNPHTHVCPCLHLFGLCLHPLPLLFASSCTLVNLLVHLFASLLIPSTCIYLCSWLHLLARACTLATQVFHEHTKLAILALLQLSISIYLQFPSSFAPYDISKCDIRYQWV